MNDIAKAKGIKFKNTDLKKDFVTQVLEGSNLKINMTSEMELCPSCDGIIKKLNIANPNQTTPKYGVYYK